MITMSSVWDRTTEVISGRAGMLAGIAALTVWAPAIVSQLIGAAVRGSPPVTTPGNSLIMLLVTLVVVVLAIWGQLALIAAASDPAVHRADAFRLAAPRIPTAIGLVFLLGFLAFLLFIPAAAILARGGVSMAALRAGVVPTVPPSTSGLLLIYFIALLIFGLWLNARLSLLMPVVLHERAGIGSYARSFALTRGLTWRLIGVVLLFGIVTLVVLFATQAVLGIIFRLILGAPHLGLAAFLTSLFTTAVSSAATVVFAVFFAQLYVARREAPPAG